MAHGKLIPTESDNQNLNPQKTKWEQVILNSPPFEICFEIVLCYSVDKKKMIFRFFASMFSRRWMTLWKRFIYE